MILPSEVLYGIIKRCIIDIRIYFDCIGKIQSNFDDVMYKTIPIIRNITGLTPRVILSLKRHNKAYYLEPLDMYTFGDV